MPRARILIAHPYMSASGGGNAVAAWTIQTLLGDFDVTLACVRPVDLDAVNRSFGTTLSRDDFKVRLAPARYRWLLGSVPTQGALFEANLTVRWARELDRERPFAVLLSTQNEADFGRSGLQYIHYPSWYLPRPEAELRWFHRIPGVLALYRGACFRCSGATHRGLKRNTSLANSAFVADRCREVHGGDPRVIHPPVPGRFPAVDWDERRRGVVAVGRLAPGKRWGMAVEIVEALRQRGCDLSLTLIGHPDLLEEQRRLDALAATRPWFRILTNLSREQLAEEIASHRYGIHAMENEHFGIAVAEIQRAGCIPFVHASGGPMEIVGNDPRLTFQTAAEAVEKIHQAIESPALERELRSLVESHRDWFSTERFCEAMRQAVAEFAADSG